MIARISNETQKIYRHFEGSHMEKEALDSNVNEYVPSNQIGKTEI